MKSVLAIACVFALVGTASIQASAMTKKEAHKACAAENSSLKGKAKKKAVKACVKEKLATPAA